MLPSLLASPTAHKSQKYFWKCCSKRLRNTFKRAFFAASSFDTMDWWTKQNRCFRFSPIRTITSIAASKSVQLTRPSLFVSRERQGSCKLRVYCLRDLPKVLVKNCWSFFVAEAGILSRGMLIVFFCFRESQRSEWRGPRRNRSIYLKIDIYAERSLCRSDELIRNSSLPLSLCTHVHCLEPSGGIIKVGCILFSPRKNNTEDRQSM